MKLRGRYLRILPVAAVLVAGTLSPSCGGGDGGGSRSIVATFTPSSASPGAGTVTMQAGSGSGTLFRVRIAATDINDFFGAAFRVSYRTDDVSFQGMDSAGSFLRDGGIPSGNLDFRVDSGTAGELRVVATRIAPSSWPGVDVSGSRDLVVLSFRARRAVASSPLGFVAGSLEVRSSVQPPPEGQEIPVSWAGGTMTAN